MRTVHDIYNKIRKNISWNSELVSIFKEIMNDKYISSLSPSSAFDNSYHKCLILYRLKQLDALCVAKAVRWARILDRDHGIKLDVNQI